MMYPNTTPVPNSVFDVYLQELQSAELKVLLVIIRQTLGWTDRRATFGRKQMDWISNSQLQAKTGSSRRSISSATETLIKKNLIEVLDGAGNLLIDPHKRQGKLRLFYRPSVAVISPVENMGITGAKQSNSGVAYAKFAQDLSKKSTALVQKMRITKETLQN